MIDVKVESQEVVATLQDMSQRARNLLPVMQDFGEYVQGSIRQGDTLEGLTPLKASSIYAQLSQHKTYVHQGKKGFANFKSFNRETGAWGTYTEAGSAAVAGRKLLQRSGLMLSSVNWQATPNSVTLAPGVPYAKYQQFGTPAYDIKPKDKKALFWPGAAHPCKIVHFPGLPPRPFMRFLDKHLAYLQQKLPEYVITRRSSV